MLRPGDRVRYTGVLPANQEKFIGETAVVVRNLAGFSSEVVRVKWDSRKFESSHFAGNFEPLFTETDECESFFV